LIGHAPSRRRAGRRHAMLMGLDRRDIDGARSSSAREPSAMKGRAIYAPRSRWSRRRPTSGGRSVATVSAHSHYHLLRLNQSRQAVVSVNRASARHRISGCALWQMAGIDLLHLQYRGNGPAVHDLMGERITMMFLARLDSDAACLGRHPEGDRHDGAARGRCFRDFRRAPNRPGGLRVVGWFGMFDARRHARARSRKGRRRRKKVL